MQLARKEKDFNILVLTDIEIMTLSNILSQYQELANLSAHARKKMAAKLDKLIKEKL